MIVPTVLVATLLAGLALLHVYWARGGRRPARSDESLAMLVVGTRGPMPSPMACYAVAVLLAIGALLVLAASGLVSLPLPSLLVMAGAWGVALAFAARGLGGFVEARFRPEVRELPYHFWNLRLYSPLCLALAALAALAIA